MPLDDYASTLFRVIISSWGSNILDNILKAIQISEKAKDFYDWLKGRTEPTMEKPDAAKTSLQPLVDDNGCTLCPEILDRFNSYESRLTALERAADIAFNLILNDVKDEVRAKVSRAVQDKNQLHLAKLAIIEAEASGGCVLNPALPYDQNRQVFLYLAGAKYANQIATLDIAIHHQFLWRKYFINTGDNAAATPQAIANIAAINAGDIIILAFRNGDSTFRILSALVVQPEVAGLIQIPFTPDTPVPPTSPFRQVDPLDPQNNALLHELTQHGYELDPRVGNQVGLPVCMLNTDFETDLAKAAYDNPEWDTPGQNAIWSSNHQKIPQPVRDWMNSLIQPPITPPLQ